MHRCKSIITIISISHNVYGDILLECGYTHDHFVFNRFYLVSIYNIKNDCMGTFADGEVKIYNDLIKFIFRGKKLCKVKVKL